MSIPSAGWMLQHIPIKSYFAAEDEACSLRVVGGVDDTLFGYPIESILGKKHILSNEFLGAEDREVARAHREAVWLKHSPVISRLDIIDRDRGPIPCLLASHGLYDGGERVGVSGVLIELGGVPELQVEKGVLARGTDAPNWNQRTSLPPDLDREWLVEVLPVAFVVSVNDPNYTIRHLSGSMERIVGHSSQQILSGKPKSWSLIDPTQLDLADEKLERAIQAKQNVILRLTLAHRLGTAVPILAIVAPYMPAGHKNGFFVSAVLDITGAKALHGKTQTFVLQL